MYELKVGRKKKEIKFEFVCTFRIVLQIIAHYDLTKPRLQNLIAFNLEYSEEMEFSSY